jgi:hypothetical protein
MIDDLPFQTEVLCVNEECLYSQLCYCQADLNNITPVFAKNDRCTCQQVLYSRNKLMGQVKEYGNDN